MSRSGRLGANWASPVVAVIGTDRGFVGPEVVVVDEVRNGPH